MRSYAFYTILFFFFGCSNRAQEKDRILRDFDSVVHHLEESKNSFRPFEEEYDSLLSVSWNEYPLRQFHYTINDFHAFMQHVRTRFYEAAGDSTGSALPGKSWHDRSLTISFFSDKTNGSFALYEQLESVVSAMKGQARQEDSTLQKIKKFEAITTGLAESQEELAEKYFADAPPVAVITILGSFENTVRQICYDILLHCYKTK